jgi:3-oxo-5-alpha-steroid 4-dehydrogenase 3
VKLSSARGKLWSNKKSLALTPSSSHGGLLAFMQHLSVPQSWFLHFYALGACFNLLLLLLLSSSHNNHPSEGGSSGLIALMPLAFFELHLIRRLIETQWIMSYPKDSRMHLLAYLFGLSYYIVVPLTLASGPELILSTQQWISGNGSVIRVMNLSLAKMMDAVAMSPSRAPLISGAAVFLLANVLQLWSHHLLSLLSRPSVKGKGSRYTLPYGGPFELITCPHYLAEILIYLGMALICWSIDWSRWIGSLMILAWVTVNLVLAAEATQKWYEMETRAALKKKRGLKRLIPYLW